MITAWIIIAIICLLNVLLTVGLLVMKHKTTSISELFGWLTALSASIKVITLLI